MAACRISAWLGGVLAMLALGCGDDGGTVPDAAADSTTTDTAPDAVMDGGPMGEPFTVLVGNGIYDDAPVEGVTVTVTSASGTVTGTTDADGRVTLANVVVEGARIELSAPGMVASTVLNVTAAHVSDFTVGDAYFMRTSPIATTLPRVTVSGTFSNQDPTANWHTVSADRGLSGYAGPDDTYSVEILPDRESIATVLEFETRPAMVGARAARSAVITLGRLLTLPATTVDVTVDVDMAMGALPIETATGTFPIPAAPHPMHDSGLAFFTVTDLDHPSWFLGESGHLSADVDNTRFDYEANWIAPAEASRVVTRYVMFDSPTYVTATTMGYPTDGAQDVTFPAVPDIVTPAFGTPLAVGDTLNVMGIDPTHVYSVQVRDERGAEPVLVWQVLTTAGSEITLPPPPEHAEVDVGGLGGQIVVCDMEDPGPRGWCSRTAASRAFDVAL